MTSEIWVRRVTQAMLSAALVAGMVGMAWYSSSNNHRSEEDVPEALQSMVPDDSFPNDSFDEDAFAEPPSTESPSMPACVELKRAFEGLDKARDALLREAAGGGSENAAQAVRSYRQAVEAVRQNAERVRSRSTPDEYRRLWRTLASNRNDEREDETGLAEVQLGILSVGSQP